VDPGTYCYTNPKAERDRFRGTGAHATLAIDGASSSEPGGPFGWHRVAEARPLHWRTDERLDYVEGEHDGYAALEPGLRHRRAILFIKGGYWVVRDRVMGGAASHAYAVAFPCAAGIGVEPAGALDAVRLVAERPEPSQWRAAGPPAPEPLLLR